MKSFREGIGLPERSDMSRLERYIEVIQDLKDHGIAKDEALNCLEFDSDQDPCPKELNSALDKVYGAE